MPRGKEFTDFERRYIMAAIYAGKSIPKIAKELHRTAPGIRGMLKRVVSKRRSGRPRKLSLRDERRIIRIASNSAKSAGQIRAESGVNVSCDTIRRLLNSCSCMKRQKMMEAPRLKHEHIWKRLEFASANAERDWSKVGFLSTYFLQFPLLGDIFG